MLGSSLPTSPSWASGPSFGTNNGPAAAQRPSLRRALIRFLGGNVESRPPVVGYPAPAAPVPAASTGALALEQAERCYAYAEQLANQGAIDLAGPIYRQAYQTLRGIVGLDGAAMGFRPSLPPAGGTSAGAHLARRPGPAQAVPMAHSAPVPPPALSLEQRLQPLKEQLSASTAAAIQQELQKLLQEGHRDSDLTNLMGLAALLQKQGSEAERWFRDTVTLNPHHYRAMVNLGGICLASGRLQEASQLLTTATELVDPNSNEALASLTNLSLAQQQLGRPMEAAQLALRIFRIKPDHLRPESLAAAAQTLESMGEETAAIELLQYLRRQGCASDTIRQLAQLLERRGDFQEAAMVYRDLLAQPGAMAGQP
jgi:tetratricopeptide (TPR) repeat protein